MTFIYGQEFHYIHLDNFSVFFFIRLIAKMLRKSHHFSLSFEQNSTQKTSLRNSFRKSPGYVRVRYMAFKKRQPWQIRPQLNDELCIIYYDCINYLNKYFWNYDAILTARYEMSSNEDFPVSHVHSVLQLGQCHNKHQEQQFTVNSLYSGHHGDLKLVSSLARVYNNWCLIQPNVCSLFWAGI